MTKFMQQNNDGRRRMWGEDQDDIHARRTQATRDALKRKQKLKQSRIVKRHVLYKQKKQLLNKLESEEMEGPILSSELGRPGQHIEDEAEADEDEADEDEADEDEADEDEADEVKVEVRNEGKDEGKDRKRNSNINNNDGKEKERGTQHEYMPFARQRKEFEEWRKQREAEQRAKDEEIKQHEKAVIESRKRRKNQAKQYRKTNRRGQPKLKHRVESILERLQEMRKEDNQQ